MTNPPFSSQDFKRPLLEALGELTNMTPETTAVRLDAVIAKVLTQMGIVNDDVLYGRNNGVPLPQRWVHWAFASLCHAGLTRKIRLNHRSHWLLTNAGVQALKESPCPSSSPTTLPPST